jgi:hypothetical protein
VHPQRGDALTFRAELWADMVQLLDTLRDTKRE